MKTTLYKLVTDHEPGKFSLKVSHYLSEGWALYGSPVVAAHGTSQGYSEYCQAITKEVEVTEH